MWKVRYRRKQGDDKVLHVMVVLLEMGKSVEVSGLWGIGVIFMCLPHFNIITTIFRDILIFCFQMEKWALRGKMTCLGLYPDFLALKFWFDLLLRTDVGD